MSLTPDLGEISPQRAERIRQMQEVITEAEIALPTLPFSRVYNEDTDLYGSSVILPCGVIVGRGAEHPDGRNETLKLQNGPNHMILTVFNPAELTQLPTEEVFYGHPGEIAELTLYPMVNKSLKPAFDSRTFQSWAVNYMHGRLPYNPNMREPHDIQHILYQWLNPEKGFYRLYNQLIEKGIPPKTAAYTVWQAQGQIANDFPVHTLHTELSGLGSPIIWNIFSRRK